METEDVNINVTSNDTKRAEALADAERGLDQAQRDNFLRDRN
jgi:hypothetical protein